MHADMESTGLHDASFDLVVVQFVTHELPHHAIESLVRECRRMLRPGGVLAIADNNPRSKVIQNLPPVLFTLMKRCAGERCGRVVVVVVHQGAAQCAGVLHQ